MPAALPSRLVLTALVALFELAHLAWEHLHGGIQTHYLLHSEDLPAFYNGWGMLLLPALTWFLIGRMQRRVGLAEGGGGGWSGAWTPVIVGFLLALTAGAVLALGFTLGYDGVSSTVFFGALLAAVFLPIHRSECVLGFILGMTLVFGAVLPTIISSVIVVISAFFGHVVRPGILWMVKAAMRTRPADASSRAQ